MLDRLGQLWRELRGGSLRLVGTAGLVLLAWGTLAPVGTLVWWLSEGAERLGLDVLGRPRSLPPSDRSNAQEINCYIVFLPGVGDFSTDQLTEGESYFLDRLVEQHPNCVTVSDVFPYSAANQDLVGRRWFEPLQKFAERGQQTQEIASLYIKIRNLWRFALSTDDRYGTVYNQGIATAIVDRMNAAHPLGEVQLSRMKIVLVGTSGGAQVALGAAPYLREWIDPSQLTVVSVGGVFSGDRGFEAAQRVYHMEGDRDWIEDLGWIFPSRWAWVVGSPFNQALRSGEYDVVRTGNHKHDGGQGYFGEEQVQEDVMYVDLTLRAIEQLPIWGYPAGQNSSSLNVQQN
ncbi:hypothetical protein H6F67_24645 [Microcoleus sp. FACHB-1515]|uniref:hypothetical protein n=1 Tax=Cyanophyceae TaxID=3028117 RepID=UPI001683CCC4|nr:hypothetical protein [Microcoleus sp. FACHB-1515]MBD2093041.1 hypothetical protein [Microcoleus sp. FACHB-1515]